MTFKSLTNFGGFGKAPWDIPIERYHSDGSSYYHAHRGYVKYLKLYLKYLLLLKFA